MLVLTRKLQEEICIGDNVKITVLRINGNSVRIGIEAPRDLRIVRGELELRIEEDGTVSSIACPPIAEGTVDEATGALAQEPLGQDDRRQAAPRPSSDRCSSPLKNRLSKRVAVSGLRTSSTLSLLAARRRTNQCRRNAS